MSTDTIKFCKEFIQQVSKLPLEYLEGYVDKKKAAAPSFPKPSKPVAAAPVASKGIKVTVKKLGGVAKAHEISLAATALVSALKAEVAKIYETSTDGFSLMYKGRPVSDDNAKVADVIQDPSTPVYVNLKKPSSETKVLPDQFWTDLKQLLGKHVADTKTAEKLYNGFQVNHPKYL